LSETKNVPSLPDALTFGFFTENQKLSSSSKRIVSKNERKETPVFLSLRDNSIRSSFSKRKPLHVDFTESPPNRADIPTKQKDE
jgi:hypothetical protein